MRNLVFLALLFSLTLSRAEPTQSPLTAVPDIIGADLQRIFISAPPDVANKAAASFIAYRKAFTLFAAPRFATLQIFADVRYILWINGQPVHRGPSRFDWHGSQYDTVDITTSLRNGANTLPLVVMGNGSNARMMKHATGVTLRIDAGGTTVVKTDETWRWSDQTRYRPAKVDWAKSVDVIDSRLEDGDWTLPEYQDRNWKPVVKISGDAWGPLVARRIPLLRDTPVEATLADNVKFPITLAAGQQLKFSMDRLVQAHTIISFEATKGTELALNYAGIDYSAKAGLQTYISSDSCALDGGARRTKTT